MIVALYVLSIISDAVGDAFRDSKKVYSHIFQALAIAFLLCVPFFPFEWYMLIGYGCLRIALFDYAYNLARGLELNYIGNTSLWDKFLKKLNPPNTYLLRIVALLIGVFLILHGF
jgi:hypothetical protein